jgi:hypothetical protein
LRGVVPSRWILKDEDVVVGVVVSVKGCTGDCHKTKTGGNVAIRGRR